MTYWHTGDEEHEDKRFCVEPGGMVTGLGLYTLAGSYCMSRVRYRPKAEIPAEWFIPDEWVKGQRNGSRIAKALVQNGLFDRRPGGYGFAWIRDRNTPADVLRRREEERNKKRNRKAKDLRETFAVVPDSPGGIDCDSPGGKRRDSPGGRIGGNRK
jgi:hypothetical protein